MTQNHRRMQKWIKSGLLLGTLLTTIGGTLMAQHAPAQTSEVVVHVKSLSSAERDALKQDLTASSGIELAYACVPAGILVFRATAATPQADLSTQVLILVAGRTSTNRTKELALSQAQAEERCAAARGQ